MSAWVYNSQTGQQQYSNPSQENITENKNKKKKGLQQDLPGYAGVGSSWVSTPGGVQKTYSPSSIRRDAAEQESPSVSTGIDVDPSKYTTREQTMFSKLGDLGSKSTTLANRLQGISADAQKAKESIDAGIANYNPTLDLKGLGLSGYIQNNDITKTSSDWLQTLKDKLPDYSYDTSGLKQNIIDANTDFANNFTGYNTDFIPENLEGANSASDIKSRLARLARARDTGLLGQQKQIEDLINNTKTSLDTSNTDINSLDSYIKEAASGKDTELANSILETLNKDRDTYSGLAGNKAANDQSYSQDIIDFVNEMKQHNMNTELTDKLVNGIIASGVNIDDPEVLSKLADIAKKYSKLSQTGWDSKTSFDNDLGLTGTQLSQIFSGGGDRILGDEAENIYTAPAAMNPLRKAVAAARARASLQQQLDAILGKY